MEYAGENRQLNLPTSEYGLISYEHTNSEFLPKNQEKKSFRNEEICQKEDEQEREDQNLHQVEQLI